MNSKYNEHQRAVVARAQSMHYCKTTQAQLARVALHDTRVGESPQAAAMRLVANPRQSAMRA